MGNLDVSAITNLPATTRHLIAEYEFTGAESGTNHDIVSLGIADTRVLEVHRYYGLEKGIDVVWDRQEGAGKTVVTLTGIVQEHKDNDPAAGDTTVKRL